MLFHIFNTPTIWYNKYIGAYTASTIEKEYIYGYRSWTKEYEQNFG